MDENSRKPAGESSGPAAGTTSVTVHLITWKPLRRGRLVGLADILIEVDGVEILAQGWRAEVDRAGRLLVEAPRTRHPVTGLSTPCIALPAAVGQAVAELVAEAARSSPSFNSPKSG